MSILATDKKLISFGTDYSAGSGISIIDHTISVTGEFGKTYSAGPNIGIYDKEGQPTISSKDWSSDIANASSNAYEKAVSQIPEPQDLSYISARVDENTSGIDYISSVCLTSHKDWNDTIKDASANSYTQSTSYFNDWVNGQYTGDIANITNNITALSGDLSGYYKKTETSSKEQISDAIQYVSAHAVGDVEVNNYVHNNSATIDAVNSAYQSNSASYITAHQSLDGYATESWVTAQGYITGVNIAESATWNETSNVVSSNSAQWSEGKTYEGVSPIVVNNDESKISADTWVLSAGDGVSFTENSANKVTRIDVTAQGGDEGVNSFVHNNSSTILDVNSSYKANSGTFLTAIPSDVATKGDVDSLAQSVSDTYYPKSNPSSFATEEWVNGQGFLTAHQDISNKLDSSAFSSVSGDFLTTSFSIPESGVWNETSNVVQSNSAQWAEGGGTLTGDAQGAVDIVYSTSGNIITGTKSDYNFTAKNVNKVTFGHVTFDGVNKTILVNQPEKPQERWFIGPWGYHLGPDFADGYSEQYVRVWLERTGLSSMSGSKSDKKLIWRALLDNDVEGANNTITAIAGSALAGGGDVPSGTMNVSGFEYNAVNEISGYNGSAIAQPTLSSLNTANVNNIIVTASLPTTPDANTLYLIPEA